AGAPGSGAGIGEGGVASEGGGGGAVGGGGIPIFGGGGAGGRFLSEFGIGIGEPRLLLRIDDEDVSLSHALDVDTGGGDQRQAAQAPRPAHPPFQRHPTPPRRPHDADARNAPRL